MLRMISDGEGYSQYKEAKALNIVPHDYQQDQHRQGWVTMPGMEEIGKSSYKSEQSTPKEHYCKSQ